MLNYCNNGHENIIHEYSTCPLCTTINQIDDLQQDLEHANDKVGELENKVDELEDELKLFKFKDEESPEINEDDPRKER